MGVVKMFKNEITKKIKGIIEELNIDEDIDFDEDLKSLDHYIDDFRVFEGLYEICDTTKQVVDINTYTLFMENVNKILISDNTNVMVNSINKNYKSLLIDHISLLVDLEVSLNKELNNLLKNETTNQINFIEQVKYKSASYINRNWIDRDSGRTQVRYFYNLPLFSESNVKNALYSDIRNKDKTELGYIMQRREYQDEYFFLSRGPSIKGDPNTIYVIDNVGLSLSRLPNIERTKRGNVAPEVPSLLDNGEVLVAKYRKDDSGHYDIFRTDIRNHKIQTKELSFDVELCFFFGIALLIFSKLVRNNELLLASEYTFESDNNYPVILVFRDLYQKVYKFASSNYKEISDSMINVFQNASIKKSNKDKRIEEIFSVTLIHYSNL